MIQITHLGPTIVNPPMVLADSILCPLAREDYLAFVRAVGAETGVDQHEIEGPNRQPLILAARRILVELMRRHARGELVLLSVQGALMRGGTLRLPPCTTPGRLPCYGRWDRSRHTSILTLRAQFDREARFCDPRLQGRTLYQVVEAIEARMGVNTDNKSIAQRRGAAEERQGG